MSETMTPSHEQLQAFVDGQLDGPEKAGVLLALERSDELRHRVAELRRLKDMVQLAYDELPETYVRPTSERRFGGLALAAAAGALVMLALTQLVERGVNTESPSAARTVAQVGAAAPHASDPEMVMFHIATSDDDVAAELLDQVEAVASQYRRWGRAIRIVVIANQEGLRLYEVGRTRNEQRIEALFARYDNITFAACGNTLKRFAQSGDHVQLLPQAILVDSGVAEIARRQQQSWKYIRI